MGIAEELANNLSVKLVRSRDAIIIGAMKKHLGQETIDINALIGRCHRRVQGGFEILCIDNVPIVEFGPPTFERITGAINEALNFRVLV